MSEGAKLTLLDAKRFVLGERAKFTLVGKAESFSYTVGKAKDSELRFVRCNRDYIGFFNPTDKNPLLIAGRKGNSLHDGFTPFKWSVNAILTENQIRFNQIEFWHVGKCCICGRDLTNRESIERGIGPICLQKM